MIKSEWAPFFGPFLLTLDTKIKSKISFSVKRYIVSINVTRDVDLQLGSSSVQKKLYHGIRVLKYFSSRSRSLLIPCWSFFQNDVGGQICDLSIIAFYLSGDRQLLKFLLWFLWSYFHLLLSIHVKLKSCTSVYVKIRATF